MDTNKHSKIKKDIVDHIQRKCVICDRSITVILYQDKTYRGGHYFGDIKINKINNEYWECPNCY